MPWYIKTEKFNQQIVSKNRVTLSNSLALHKRWVKELSEKGQRISSGYLVDKNKKPGGGGLLIFEANNYEEALEIIKKDPMIKNDLVYWCLQEWIPVHGQLNTN